MVSVSKNRNFQYCVKVHATRDVRTQLQSAVLLISAPFEQCVLRELSRNLSRRHTGSREVNTADFASEGERARA